MIHGTHPYSHKAAIKHAEEHLINREITLAKFSPDFQALHPAEAKEAKAANPKYIELKTRMKLKFSKNADKLEARRVRAGGKNE